MRDDRKNVDDEGGGSKKLEKQWKKVIQTSNSSSSIHLLSNFLNIEVQDLEFTSKSML